MDVNALSAQIVISPTETTWLVPLVASAIGALIGGGMALLGVIFNHKLDLRKQTKNEEDALQNLYRAIRIEFSEIWKAYNDFGAGANLERLQDGDALVDDFAAMRDYFTVYRNNATLIGRIPDNELRECLVKTYIIAQVLIDAYSDYKTHLRDFKQSAQHAAESKKDEDAFTANFDMRLLKTYTKSLKAYHNLMRAAVKLLEPMLEKHIKPI